MEGDFQFDVRHEARATVITVAGELDLASSGALERELGALTDVGLTIVDLRELTFIDSTGLGVLIHAHQQAIERGHRLAFVRGNGQVARLLNLTGLDERLVVADSTEQLLASS